VEWFVPRPPDGRDLTAYNLGIRRDTSADIFGDGVAKRKRAFGGEAGASCSRSHQ